MNFALPRHIEELRAFVALMRRWFGFVLLWLARLPIKRSHHDLMLMEDRLKYLICSSVLIAGFEPGKARMGSHRDGREQEGAWLSFILRSALPKRSAFGWNRLARIKHVAANLDH